MFVLLFNDWEKTNIWVERWDVEFYYEIESKLMGNKWSEGKIQIQGPYLKSMNYDV